MFDAVPDGERGRPPGEWGVRPGLEEEGARAACLAQGRGLLAVCGRPHPDEPALWALEAAAELLDPDRPRRLQPALMALGLAHAEAAGALARRSELRVGWALARPTLLSAPVYLRPAGKGALAARAGLDVLAQGLRAWPLAGADRWAAWRFRFLHGLLFTAFEREVHPDPGRAFEAGLAFRDALAGGGGGVRLVGPGGEVPPELVPPAGREAVARALAAGQAALVPAGPGPGEWGFFRLDPATGSLLGVGPLGEGQGMAEYETEITGLGLALDIFGAMDAFACMMKCIVAAATAPFAGLPPAAARAAFRECLMKFATGRALAFLAGFTLGDLSPEAGIVGGALIGGVPGGWSGVVGSWLNNLIETLGGGK